MNPGKEVRFSDVPASAWYAEDVAKVQSEGLMGGFPDETFRPDQPVTRAQLAAVLSRLEAQGIKIQVKN